MRANYGCIRTGEVGPCFAPPYLAMPDNPPYHYDGVDWTKVWPEPDRSLTKAERLKDALATLGWVAQRVALRLLMALTGAGVFLGLVVLTLIVLGRMP